ncbi:MAG: hypothetical protein AAFW97_08500 [Pseudomonadota bacterium]
MSEYAQLKAELRLPDWRDPAAYAGIVDAGRSALVWELLRRDPEYRGDMSPPANRLSDGVEIVPLADPETIAQYGLLFR